MRMIRPALAVAAMLLAVGATTRAADLLPADRAIGEVVDHYIDAVLRRESDQASPRGRRCDHDPPVDARPGRANSHRRRVACLCRFQRS